MMSNAILMALAPVFFVLLLGYAAGRFHVVDNLHVDALNALVMDFAVPASLFAATASASRSEMIEQVPLFLVLGITMSLLYAAWYLAARRLFKVSRPDASIQALTVGFPNLAGVGLPILTSVAGQAGAVPVAVALATGSVLISPVTLIMAEMDAARSRGEEMAARQMLTAVGRAITKPVVLAPVFGIHFERELIEREAEHLAGYRGMGPVRIGNDAWRQTQHDAYGSVVLAATQLFYDRRLVVPGDAAAFKRLEHSGETAWRMHDQPDAGLWEFRGRAAVHTYSSVMSWAACDRLARIAKHLGLGDRADYWADRATRVRTLILERGVHPEHGYFVDSLDGNQLDASLLLLADLGFVSADDPRFVATVDAIGAVLRQGDHLYRYIAPDDFGTPETSFTICNFWYVDALAATGRLPEARALFEKLLAQRNHLGLLSEDVHPTTGELWGNFPQTYSLVGLVNAAMRLSRRWEELL